MADIQCSVNDALGAHRHRASIELVRTEEKLRAGANLKTGMDAWAYTSHGDLKDIKTLICTIQDVKPEEIAWNRVNFSDLVLNPTQQVRRHYQKAVLSFHPDRQG